MDADLRLKASLGDVALSADQKEEQSRIAQGIADIPVRKIMDNALHLRNVILPQIEKKQGRNSDNYRFFESVYDTLLWSIVVIDRFEGLEASLTRTKVMNILYREQSDGYYQELMKYAAFEDYLLGGACKRIASGVRKRAEELLNIGKPK